MTRDGDPRLADEWTDAYAASQRVPADSVPVLMWTAGHWEIHTGGVVAFPTTADLVRETAAMRARVTA